MNERIDELVAGRELDVLVAEKVIGWRRIHDWLGYDLPDGNASLEAGTDWSPSTDIAAAWWVVEHMRTKGVFMAVCAGELDWLVEIGEGNTFLADTAPLAICRAALAAVEASQ